MCLEEALKNYISSLRHGDKYDTAGVFRLCTLWFRNCEEPQINSIVKAGVTSLEVDTTNLYIFLTNADSQICPVNLPDCLTNRHRNT